MNNNLAWAVAALVAGAAIATAALAQRSDVAASETTRVQVRFHDLNLNNAEGRAQLNRRILGAARTICGASPSQRDLQASSAYRACIQATVASAEPSAQAAAVVQAKSQPQFAAAGNK